MSHTKDRLLSIIESLEMTGYDVEWVARKFDMDPEQVQQIADDYADGYAPTDEPWDGFNSDAEADADALAGIGWGTDEDYGYCGGDDY